MQLLLCPATPMRPDGANKHAATWTSHHALVASSTAVWIVMPRQGGCFAGARACLLFHHRCVCHTRSALQHIDAKATIRSHHTVWCCTATGICRTTATLADGHRGAALRSSCQPCRHRALLDHSYTHNTASEAANQRSELTLQHKAGHVRTRHSPEPQLVDQRRWLQGRRTAIVASVMATWLIA